MELTKMELPLKILIVDDRPENLFALEQVLNTLNVEVIKAETGNDALIASLNHDFALAIVDVQMPEMDGYELAELLRGQVQTRNLPIIFLSAVYHEEHYIFKGYDAGAVDFIIKPYHPRILLGKTAVFLELARQRVACKCMAAALWQANEALEVRVCERTTSLEKANQALLTSEQALRDLSGRLLTAQEEERKRIAAEMHDSIGSSLSAVKFSLEYLCGATRDPAAAETLTSLVQMVRQSMEEVRRIIANLRPPVLDDYGLIATIDWFEGRLRKVYNNLTIEKEISLSEEMIPGALKIVIFRVIQEALNNVAKHNPRARARIVLAADPECLDLLIRDNGSGFDVDAVLNNTRPKKGLGLTSMRERVSLSGGCIAIVSAVGQGTEIKAHWPLAP